MATGGTIPTNRTQYVTFYNTAGVIERHKNIYYVPRFSKVGATSGETVASQYLSAFEGVCPPSSAYENIEISSWSPQDRSLFVRGNIDDFRLVTDEGACLNYFIIARTIQKGDTSQTFYYAFFITGVEQAGGSSVKITAEPDDFTNVFYLHNKHLLTSSEIANDYEPFNEKMKNCYVNRQHYDRVEYGETGTLQSNTVNIPLQSQMVSVTFSGTDEFYPDSVEAHVSITEGSGTVAVSSVEGRTVRIYFSGGGSSTGVARIWATATKKGLVPANEKIFLNQEESFKFKYQYRQARYDYLINNTSVNIDMLESIKNASAYADLSLSEKTAVLKNCLSYYVIECKSMDSITKVYINGLDGVLYYPYYIDNSELIKKNVRRTSPLIIIPFIDIPEDYKMTGLSPELFLKFNFNDVVKYYDPSISSQLVQDLITALHKNNMDSDIQAIYISKDIPVTNYINIDVSSQKIYFNVTVPYNYTSYESARHFTPDINKAYVVGLLSNKSVQNARIEFTKDPALLERPNNLILSNEGAVAGIIISGELKNISTLIIPKKEDYNLRETYYDPVLDAEPYSFYSLSYQNNEIPLNKNRYYYNYEINLDISVAFNGMKVITVLPTYNVEGIEIKYLNEAMVVSSSESLPLVNDAYLTYYYQNMAQMKNQFAVNNFNRGIDLAQHFGLSGPNAVLQRASRASTPQEAGIRAGLETINQVTEMINEGIDWAQSNKVIDMNQKAKLADMGRVPDTLSQSGTEVYSSLVKNEYSLKINKYVIDTVSYNSIAKLLERAGYQINLYDSLHVMDRVGWNFIKLNGFDWDSNVDIMVRQEDTIKQIFSEGVTLLHDKSYLTTGHNYETILEE